MDTIDWLERNAPEFRALSARERKVIFEFSLLWSLFESKALNTSASSERIIALSREWERHGRIKIEDFAPALDYFKHRYLDNGNATLNFAGLRLRTNDRPELVQAVLKGEEMDTGSVIAALLIIAFRLRNNLFHGIKWADGIRDQFNNFTNANQVLMAALEYLLNA